MQVDVHFDASTEELQDLAVLVFLKPEYLQRNYQVHAWQVLPARAGAVMGFYYEPTISTDVRHDVVLTARQTVQPGELFSVVTPNGLAPILERAASSWAQEKLTPRQCGLTNQTNPYIHLDANWYVGDRPVVTMPDVDAYMTVAFEHRPIFYFLVARPPMPGQTYNVQDFSEMTSFALPAIASQIHVTLRRDHDLWRFDFSMR